ncbi:hypothetical protein F5Y05DRAFT_423660 [Hypoxylon sp. FL0543]|nr:hypothetical protein F5Y05DRAFT_423660 [Hypoxylon sp. FL0543]
MSTPAAFTSGHRGLPGGSPRMLTSADVGANTGLYKASFITNAIPDISPDACIIGLCTVPARRAGMDDLGWHIADFLAWKALLRGLGNPKAQNWMALCDVAGVANANPEQYAHGKDRRIVSVAAPASTYIDEGGNARQAIDDIKVHPSAEMLRAQFTVALEKMGYAARQGRYPVVVIICGPTTLEQDVYLGKIDEEHLFRSQLMHDALGDSIDATVITPALYSAGWQVSPFFYRQPAGKIEATPTDFLAKQFGGVFAADIVRHFFGWTCPLLDWARVDEEERGRAYPNPYMPDDVQTQTSDALKLELHGALAGRLSAGHDDHSFRFDDKNDDWVTMVGPRQYKPLRDYQEKWTSLRQGAAAPANLENFHFLGNAFGGRKTSQFSHIKYLVEESFVGWSGYWKLPLGKRAREYLRTFLAQTVPETRACHEVFSAMEHRATLGVLTDTTIERHSLIRPSQQKCRFWEEVEWMEDPRGTTRTAVTNAFSPLTRLIPNPYMPPGVMNNSFSRIQTCIQTPMRYMSASVCISYPEREDLSMEAVKRISQFFEEIKERQIELLVRDPQVREACLSWLHSICMPVRSPDESLAGVKQGKTPAQAAGNETAQEKPQTNNTEAAEVRPADVPSEQPTSEAGFSNSQNTQAQQVDDFEEAKASVLQQCKEVMQELSKAASVSELGAVRAKLVEMEKSLRLVEEAKNSHVSGHKDGTAPTAAAV